MVENGYIRSMLVRLLQGGEVEQGEYYVDAIIQHQFVGTSNLTFSTFEKVFVSNNGGSIFFRKKESKDGYSQNNIYYPKWPKKYPP